MTDKALLYYQFIFKFSEFICIDILFGGTLKRFRFHYLLFSYFKVLQFLSQYVANWIRCLNKRNIFEKFEHYYLPYVAFFSCMERGYCIWVEWYTENHSRMVSILNRIPVSYQFISNRRQPIADRYVSLSQYHTDLQPLVPADDSHTIMATA